MRVIVAGSTTWDNEEAIRKELALLPKETVVIYGDAPGADEIGGRIAGEMGLAVEPMVKSDEDYRRFRRGAWKGLNERMLASGAELILAFHVDVESSTGTKHLVQLAKDADVPVKFIDEQ